MADTVLHVSTDVFSRLCIVAGQLDVPVSTVMAGAIHHYWISRTQVQRVEATQCYLDQSGVGPKHAIQLPAGVLKLAGKCGPGPHRIQHIHAALWHWSQQLPGEQTAMVRDFAASAEAAALMPETWS